MLASLALDYEVLTAVGGETVSQGPYGGREALFFRVEDHADVGLVFGGGRRDQALPRGRGRTRLDARGRPVSEQQLVGAGQRYLPVRGADGRVLRGNYLSELRVLHGQAGHPGQVSRARVVAPGVEAHGVLEAGVLQPRRLRPLVHLLDEAVYASLASTADVFGQGVRGVVAGGDQGGHQ